MAKSDPFLRDAIRPEKAAPTLTFMDGFRFGFGAFIAVLLGSLIVGGLAVVLAQFLHFS